MAAFPRNDASRRKNEFLSLGPDCAALTSTGTVYLYRLTAGDLAACAGSSSARSPGERIRALLGRIASASVSDKGVGAAGPLKERQLASLNDDEVERLAEAYLESPGLHVLRHEAETASPALRREAGEPATAFLDRLVRWHALPQEAPVAEAAPAAAIPATPDTPQEAPVREEPPRARGRWSWLTGALLFFAASLALAALLQSQFTLQTLRRDKQDLATQLVRIRETNDSLGTQINRLETENADLRRRMAAMDASLRATQMAPPPVKAAQAPAKARESKPRRSVAKSATAKKRSSHLGRVEGATRLPRY